MQDISGVICATLTPFISDIGLVDYEWIPAHLRFLESHGIHGVLALGTTGEGPSLGLSERQRVLDLVLSHRGGLAVIAGTGCAALAETVTLSQYALDHGADAILVMPPFYFKNGRPEGMLNYYRALCDALPEDARLLLYHIPAVTAVPITPLMIEGLLASHAHQFYGIKDSSGDIQHTMNLIQRYPQLQIFSGSDTQVANALIRAARAARLLGAQVILTGIQPQIAQTLVQLGADLNGIVTHSNLKSGIAFALGQLV